jgi:heme/copper-type cytochrome/quinol oxidase subunit 3
VVAHSDVPKILWVNTAIVLLVSSFTAEMARRSMFREHDDAMDEWIGFGTAALATGQVSGWD